MSKSLKKIVGIAAALIVPYAAPIISGAIGLSGAIGGVLGSGLTGAVLGGASTAALGGDWKKGALFGGLGGGIGGYLNPTGASTMFGIQGDPSAGAFGAASAGGTGGATAGLSTGGNIAPLPSVDAMAQSTNYGQGAVTGVMDLGQASGFNAAQAAQAPVAQGGKLAQVIDRLKAAPGELAKKVTDPKFLADLTLKAGMMAAGTALAGNMAGMSLEEQQLLTAQAEDMQLMRMQNKDLYDLRMAQAQKMLNEADQYDPAELGRQASRQEQVRSGIATTEGLRGIRDDSKRQAEARRYALGASKNTGTAFQQGQQIGGNLQSQYRQAGLNALPAPSSLTSYSGLADAYGAKYTRQREARDDIGSFIGGLFNDKSTGDNSMPSVNYNIYQPPA